MINPTMGLRQWLALGLLSLLWGGSFFLNEILLRELRPFTLVFGRTLLAALTLILVLQVTGRRLPRDWSSWRAFAVMGLLNNLIPFSLIVWGQQSIDGGLAAILTATTPLFSVILAHFLTGEERLTAGRVTGVLLGLAGVAVLVGPEALRGLGFQAWAQIAILGAACSYALAGIYGRRFRGLPPLVPAAGMLCWSVLYSLPLALILEQPWLVRPGLATWAALVGLAVVSTALAYQIYFRLLASAGVTNVLLVTILIPVSAVLLGASFLNERLSWSLAAGMGLIGAGLLAVDGRLARRVVRPAPVGRRPTRRRPAK